MDWNFGLNDDVVKTEKILKSTEKDMFQSSIVAITPLSSSVYDKIFVDSSKNGNEGVFRLTILYTFPMSSMLSLYFFCLNLS